MRYEVDQDACVASGYCTQVAPGYFALEGDAAEAIRDGVDVADEDVVLEAETLCPAGAIRVR